MFNAFFIIADIEFSFCSSIQDNLQDLCKIQKFEFSFRLLNLYKNVKFYVQN
jgi:hypothetical protein